MLALSARSLVLNAIFLAINVPCRLSPASPRIFLYNNSIVDVEVVKPYAFSVASFLRSHDFIFLCGLNRGDRAVWRACIKAACERRPRFLPCSVLSFLRVGDLSSDGSVGGAGTKRMRG